MHCILCNLWPVVPHCSATISHLRSRRVTVTEDHKSTNLHKSWSWSHHITLLKTSKTSNLLFHTSGSSIFAFATLHIRQQHLSSSLSFPIVELSRIRISLILRSSWLTSSGEHLLQGGDLEWFQIKMSIDRLEEERDVKGMSFICFSTKKNCDS